MNSNENLNKIVFWTWQSSEWVSYFCGLFDIMAIHMKYTRAFLYEIVVLFIEFLNVINSADINYYSRNQFCTMCQCESDCEGPEMLLYWVTVSNPASPWYLARRMCQRRGGTVSPDENVSICIYILCQNYGCAITFMIKSSTWLRSIGAMLHDLSSSWHH